MSFFVTEAVIMTEDIPPLAKLVLCVLAKHANHDGSNARPSQDTIKAMAGMGKSTVAKWLAWLEDAVYIVPTGCDGGGRGHAVEYRICTERLYHVEGLQYRNGVNLLPNGTFNDEKDLRGEKKDLRGGVNLLRGGQKDLPRRSHSVSDSVRESVHESERENQRDRTRDPHGNTKANVTPISLSRASHDDRPETPQDSKAIHILCAALLEHCTPPKASDRDQTPYYARELVKKGATPPEVPKRIKAWKDKCWNNGAQPNITPKVLYEHWEELGPKTAPANNAAAERERQFIESVLTSSLRLAHIHGEISDEEYEKRKAERLHLFRTGQMDENGRARKQAT